VFTNLNIQAIIGTDQPAAVFAYNRQLIFGNRFGAYSLNGTTAQKISDDIDGTWQYLTFAQPLSGGQVVVNNILTAAILLNQTADPETGLNTVIAMWWDGKWWFANYGNVTFILSAYTNNLPSLYAFIGNKLYQCFADSTTSPSTEWIGPLWDMGDPIRTKEAITCGMELQITGTFGSISLNLDTANKSIPIVLGSPLSLVQWQNNSGTIVQWQNNSLATVTWYNTGYALLYAMSTGGYSKYIGMSGSAVGTQFQLSGLMMDYEFGARWSP
jgi:hypothetical protein